MTLDLFAPRERPHRILDGPEEWTQLWHRPRGAQEARLYRWRLIPGTPDYDDVPPEGFVLEVETDRGWMDVRLALRRREVWAHLRRSGSVR
jgi:hypothetical protein